MPISYSDLWAKTNPYKALWQHMLDVGFTAQALLTNTSYSHTLALIAKWLGGDQENALSFICYVAALHDIGKCHPVFQGGNPETATRLRSLGIAQTTPMGRNFRHEIYSEVVVKRLLPRRTSCPNIRRLIPAVIRLHHQGKSGDTFSIYEKPEIFERMQDELESICYECFPIPPAFTINDCGHVDALCTLTSAIVVLSDWIASSMLDISFLPENANPRDYAILLKEKAAVAVKACGFHECRCLPPARSYDTLWPGMTSLRPVQKTVDVISAQCPQLLIVEAPMGEGKTEASLLALTRMAKAERGLYFALPTSATSNLMYKRLEIIFDECGLDGLRLLHGSAWLADWAGISFKPHGETAEAASWLLPLRRALLEQNAVGTVDQAMMSVLRIQYGILRLLGLSGKVVIVDEIHAYDTYMSTILERMLAWCAELEVPVILLSATLPRKRRDALIAAYTGVEVHSQNHAYPLVTSASGSSVIETLVGDADMRRTLKIECIPIMNNADAIAMAALERVDTGGCLSVIVNTVGMAQAVYRAIQGFGRDNLWTGLLHSRFPAAKRDALESTCNALFGKHGDRPNKAILVSTQIVEQSCDFSFDYMMSEIAPIDLLLQRSGRILRHKNVGLWGEISPTLCVLVPNGMDFGSSKYVYFPYLLKKTLAYIEGVDAIMIPKGMRDAVEAIYDADPDEREMEEWLKRDFTQELQSAEANSVLMRAPDPERFGMRERYDMLSQDDETGALRASTRLSEPTKRVILLPRAEIPSAVEMNNISTEHIQMLFQHGLSLRDSQLIESPAAGYDAPIVGTGRLKGCLLYIMHDNVYEGRRKDKTFRYILDDKLGLIIERGE